MIWRGGGAIPGETYLLPTHGIGSVHQVRVTLKLGQRIWIEDWDPSSPGPLVVGPPANQLTVQVDLVPLPARIEVPSTNDEVEDELRALGYAE